MCVCVCLWFVVFNYLDEGAAPLKRESQKELFPQSLNVVYSAPIYTFGRERMIDKKGTNGEGGGWEEKEFFSLREGRVERGSIKPYQY